MRPDNLIRTGKLLLMEIAIFPPKTPVTLAAEGNGGFVISQIIFKRFVSSFNMKFIGLG